MTFDYQTEQHLKDLPSNDTQRPFHIVLVDINKAANGNIHCVEFPLTSDVVNYVALSYRWGELQEKMIDTDVGYIATVTSFRLKDFCQMCRAMTHEFELRAIQYVWIDGICVDQQNYEKRKATIHQMTNIYQHATFVVAVPDLHLQYLKNTSIIHRHIIQRVAPFRKDLYYLLHKNIDALVALEQERLDFYGVPKDPALRQLLIKYTDFFAEGLTLSREHHYDYNPEEILDHIYESTIQREDKTQAQVKVNNTTTNGKALLGEIEQLHDCEEAMCPFVTFHHHGKAARHNNKHHHHKPRSGRNREWKQQIYDRSSVIQDAMQLMTSLMVDWSSRAWVISEFNIAKKKNNLKYWFIQLIPGTTKEIHPTFGPEFAFFDFKFNDPSHGDIQNTIINVATRSSKTTVSDPVYLKFHQIMIRQLKEQTFLEMLLKSKASREEDRFYSVLPLSEKYKDKLTEVSNWGITTTLSVKLKLYEWMDTKDKLNLVFLSSYRKQNDSTLILPTFATTPIYWSSSTDCFITPSNNTIQPLFNFDLENESTIMFHHYHDLYSIHLKPFEYYVHIDQHRHQQACQAFLLKKTSLCKRVQLNDLDKLDVVAIPNVVSHSSLKPTFWIHLIGSFTKNKWVFDKYTLACSPADSSDWVHCHSHNNSGFIVY